MLHVKSKFYTTKHIFISRKTYIEQVLPPSGINKHDKHFKTGGESGERSEQNFDQLGGSANFKLFCVK